MKELRYTRHNCAELRWTIRKNTVYSNLLGRPCNSSGGCFCTTNWTRDSIALYRPFFIFTDRVPLSDNTGCISNVKSLRWSARLIGCSSQEWPWKTPFDGIFGYSGQPIRNRNRNIRALITLTFHPPPGAPALKFPKISCRSKYPQLLSTCDGFYVWFLWRRTNSLSFNRLHCWALTVE